MMPTSALKKVTLLKVAKPDSFFEPEIIRKLKSGERAVTPSTSKTPLPLLIFL
jgi:hypothetical protein